MIDLPISEYMRNYYKENGFVFPDSAQAAIFWNSALPLPERLNVLREIADKTDDETLKAEILSLLDTEAKYEEWFKEDDSRYYYILEPTDFDDKREFDKRNEYRWLERRWADEGVQDFKIFSDFNSAFAFGSERCSGTFKIKKEPFTDKVDDCVTEEDYGESTYQEDGSLLDWFCYTKKIGIPELHGFEYNPIPIQSPFDLGDIVCNEKGDSCLSIIWEERERWEKHQRDDTPYNSFTESHLMNVFDFSKGSIRYWDDAPIFPLKKVEQWDDELEWEVLKAASEIMKKTGGVHLDDVARFYDISEKERLDEKNVPYSVDIIEECGCRAELDKFGELYCKWRDREKKKEAKL